MNAATLLLTAALTLGGPQDKVARSANPAEVILPRCLVDIVDQRDVPALDAGRLLTVEYHEGDIVDAGTLLATIDDREAIARRDVAKFELQAAKGKASNDVNIKFAIASKKVAWFEYNQKKEANHKQPGTISKTELSQLWFQYERARYQIEQANKEIEISKIEALGAEAQLRGAELVLGRRRISAPIGGVVVEVYRKDGDWVEPGDPVMHIVFLERLRVKGTVDAKNYSPAELDSRPVSVEVELSRGRRETFEGKIVFVDPQIDQRGHFDVWAEVNNRVETGHWILQPGREGSMTIDVGPDIDPNAEVGQFPATGTIVR